MQNSSAVLIQRVAREHSINLYDASVPDVFHLYALVLREIERMLSDDLANFPLASVLLIQSAIREIRNACNFYQYQDIDERTYNKISQINPLLATTLSKINTAVSIHHQTMQNPRLHYEMYDLFQEALVLCGNIIVNINALLVGW